MTAEGKDRSARNALRHGLRAERFVVVGDEDPQQFAALDAAQTEELAPAGALQGLLAGRIARAAWRLERAERIEGQLLDYHLGADRNLALALIRDGNGTRAVDTLLRYRGTALAELWRALRLLKALQAETGRQHALPQLPEPEADAGVSAPEQGAPCENPNQPEVRRNPSGLAAAQPIDEPVGQTDDGACSESALAVAPQVPVQVDPPADHALAAPDPKKPDEPEVLGKPGRIDPSAARAPVRPGSDGLAGAGRC